MITLITYKRSKKSKIKIDHKLTGILNKIIVKLLAAIEYFVAVFI